MNQNQAKVISIDFDHAWVEIPRRVAACGNCQSKENCQTGLLGIESDVRRYRLLNDINARVGDTVELCTANGTLLRASFVSYLLPTLLALGGAGTGQFFANDAGALFGTLAGLALGVLWLRRTERIGNSKTPLLSIRHLSLS